VQGLTKHYADLARKHIKQTMQYASLQDAHEGLANDMKEMRKLLHEEYVADDFESDAMIMASQAAMPF